MFSFCAGAAPIPLSALVCYPSALILGGFALISGMRALRQIRSSGENGRILALFGAWMGLFTILAVLCASALTYLALVYGVEAIQPLLQRLWY